MSCVPVEDEPSIRERLVQIALVWESRFGNAPAITSAISEYDAAMLLGMPEAEYSACMRGVSAVRRGYDFISGGERIQVKANRPSGKPGSKVTLVPKASNFDWDQLIWILYDERYVILEAWQWDVERYRETFLAVRRLSPAHHRQGTRLFSRDS